MKTTSIGAGALCTIGLLFFFMGLPAIMKKPDINTTPDVKQSTLYAQFHPSKVESQRGPCYCGVMITLEENMEILNCMATFEQLKRNRGKINGHAMETERVDGHSYLNENSFVLEIGGYTGQDAAKLIKKYNPYYTALEPMPRFQKILEERYKNNRKFKLLKFGLGRKATTLTVNVNSDATSLFSGGQKPQNSKAETAEIKEITQFFDEIDVKNKPIDLLTINCEGCEYEMLELLIANHIVDHVKNIQFQFHLGLQGIDHQDCRYCQIMTLLSRSHRPSFQYLYVWQSWRRKV